MSDPKVHAASATQTVLNRTRNWLTRVTDLEIWYSEQTSRRARSKLGVLCPCAGPFSIYRAEVIRDNVDDYLASGTFSDDRRLAHYALLRGKVVMALDSIVKFDMPNTIRDAFRQRVRWFKGAWFYMPWELKHLPSRPLIFRLWNLIAWTAYPVIIAWALILSPMLGKGLYWHPLIYWLSLLYLQTSVYLSRVEISKSERVLTWLMLTPLLSVWQLAVIRPAMYWAITQTRSSAWLTRGRAVRAATSSK